MGFKYHPPTRSACSICEHLKESDHSTPIIDTYDGRSSSANGYPFHDWYNFVLGYTPAFPQYMLNRMNITSDNQQVVLDPFGGSGTTQLVCKLNGIPSYGVDANNFMVFAATQKLNWTIDISFVKRYLSDILKNFHQKFENINWGDDESIAQFAAENRPDALDIRYISDKPLAKIKLLREAINCVEMSDEYHDFFMFAISSILVSVSNVKYGPGFGVGKIKDDADVLSYFTKKVDAMLDDLSSTTEVQKKTEATTILGDSRRLSNYIEHDSISLIVTSPPYPGDHEYTKHSKLELIFNGYATDISSFRVIKKRMIRGSTTNIYKDDNDRQIIFGIDEIKQITDEIAHRLECDGGTSGFEKLYVKLVWEYFGGMAHTLQECYSVLKPGGTIALLVSDSHAFKMVHIMTAELLKLIGLRMGFVNAEVILWQLKNSTSHKYQLRENILLLQKPE